MDTATPASFVVPRSGNRDGLDNGQGRATIGGTAMFLVPLPARQTARWQVAEALAGAEASDPRGCRWICGSAPDDGTSCRPGREVQHDLQYCCCWLYQAQTSPAGGLNHLPTPLCAATDAAVPAKPNLAHR